MNREELKAYCESLPCVTSDFPFDEETVVFRLEGKIFALANVFHSPLKVNLKCEPGLARDLRQSFPEIVPGYHMNKEHWNTVNLEGNLEPEFIHKLLRMSYDLILAKLPKSVRDKIAASLKSKPI